MNPRDKQQIRSALDQSCRDLDGPTLARLHQARNRALESASRRPLWRRLPLIPTTAIATAGAAAMVFLMVLQGPAVQQLDPVDPLAAEMLAAGESLELYDDLEFLMWLSEQELDVG